jgi:hypothetical protein
MMETVTSYTEKLHDLQTSLDVIKMRISSRLRWITHRINQKCIKIFVGKPERKRPLGRPRYRCEDNIKLGLMEIGYESENWIKLARDTVQWLDLVNHRLSNYYILKDSAPLS